ncbi:MAG TPA: hypothetical protein VFZ18_00880 [Longimicrobiaceae bacterium]
MKRLLPLAALVAIGSCASAGSGAGGANGMSFFVTSAGPGSGANLGGLAGADEHCRRLAAAVGQAVGKTWRAYLSAHAAGGQPAVNARDRIGQGPWYNANGVMIARDLAQLHSEEAATGKANSVNERGEVVNGRGDTPNRHDILTGSLPDGTVAGGAEATCNNWTSGGEGSAMAGHHDRQGGGERPTSWNSAHLSRGCSQENLQSTGGDGLFYCFAS